MRRAPGAAARRWRRQPPAAAAPRRARREALERGGAVEVVATATRELFALAVDEQRVFWSDDGVSPCTDPVDFGYEIVARSKQGASAATFGASQQFAPATDMVLDDAFV